MSSFSFDSWNHYKGFNKNYTIDIFVHKILIKKVCHVFLRCNTTPLVLQSKCAGKYLPHDEKFIAGIRFAENVGKKYFRIFRILYKVHYFVEAFTQG